MDILFIITARGGSKGVPKKNIKKLGGIPLIAYKIISAKKCKYNSRIIVSTDDLEIAEVAQKYGAEVPFIRPEYLATDHASSIDVVCHAIQWIEENDSRKYDYICLLEPSSPFAAYDDYDKALDIIIRENGDTLLSVKEVEVSTNFINCLDDEGKLSLFYNSVMNCASMRRQDQKKEYTMNGCMYIAKWDYFKSNKSFHSINSIPYIMEDVKSVEVDTMLDYYLARAIVDNGLVDISLWES